MPAIHEDILVLFIIAKAKSAAKVFCSYDPLECRFDLLYRVPRNFFIASTEEKFQILEYRKVAILPQGTVTTLI